MSVDEEVNLDEVIDRILPVMNDVASVDTPIRINRQGTLGVLDADRATALIASGHRWSRTPLSTHSEPEATQGA